MPSAFGLKLPTGEVCGKVIVIIFDHAAAAPPCAFVRVISRARRRRPLFAPGKFVSDCPIARFRRRRRFHWSSPTAALHSASVGRR